MKEYTAATRYHQPRQLYTHTCIMLPNGAKCNICFYWDCVILGILTAD